MSNATLLGALAGAGLLGVAALSSPITSSISAGLRSQKGQVGPAINFGFKRGLNELKNEAMYGGLTGLAGAVLGAGIGAAFDAPGTGAVAGGLIGSLPGMMYGQREHLNELDSMFDRNELEKIFGKRYPLELGEV